MYTKVKDYSEIQQYNHNTNTKTSKLVIPNSRMYDLYLELDGIDKYNCGAEIKLQHDSLYSQSDIKLMSLMLF